MFLSETSFTQDIVKAQGRTLLVEEIFRKTQTVRELKDILTVV